MLHMHTEDWVSCSTGGAEGTTGAVVEKERWRLLRLLIVTVSLKSLESRKASIRDLDILTGDADLVSLETACLDLVHCTDLMTLAEGEGEGLGPPPSSFSFCSPSGPTHSDSKVCVRSVVGDSAIPAPCSIKISK